MNSSAQPDASSAEPVFFPPAWLLAEPMRTILSVSPIGICLFGSVREEQVTRPGTPPVPGPIIDFRYLLVNPVLQALLRLPAEDMLDQCLTQVAPGTQTTEMIDRLTRVVRTGRPDGYITAYSLDEYALGYHYHLYVKSGDGVLALIQDVTFHSLSSAEQAGQTNLLQAIENNRPVADVRLMLINLISGQAHQ